MKIAFIMDPLEKVNPSKDTTYTIMQAAEERGHQVYKLDHRDMWVLHDRVYARMARVFVHNDPHRPFTVEPCLDLALDEMDVVMIRTDPPFDRTYFYTTLILDFLPASTRVVNRPSGLRNWNEKLAATFYADFMPRTLVSQDLEVIKRFLHEHDRITLKPIDGYAGKGIIFVAPDDANLDQRIDMATHGGRHRIIAQEYLPAAADGDKRILLLNGKPMGAILRVHAKGEELNNLDAGGTAHSAELDSRDREICTALEPGLVEQGIVFAGIDVIGGKLIEVNVTSPTGLRQLCEFSGTPHHHHIIEALEAPGP